MLKACNHKVSSTEFSIITVLCSFSECFIASLNIKLFDQGKQKWAQIFHLLISPTPMLLPKLNHLGLDLVTWLASQFITCSKQKNPGMNWGIKEEAPKQQCVLALRSLYLSSCSSRTNPQWQACCYQGQLGECKLCFLIHSPYGQYPIQWKFPL